MLLYVLTSFKFSVFKDAHKYKPASKDFSLTLSVHLKQFATCLQ